jgi:hypothetical protein
MPLEPNKTNKYIFLVISITLPIFNSNNNMLNCFFHRDEKVVSWSVCNMNMAANVENRSLTTTEKSTSVVVSDQSTVDEDGQQDIPIVFQCKECQAIIGDSLSWVCVDRDLRSFTLKSKEKTENVSHPIYGHGPSMHSSTRSLFYHFALYHACSRPALSMWWPAA